MVGVRHFASSARTGGVKLRGSDDVADVEENEEDMQDDLLEGKVSGDNLRKAFLERSAAATRYEYFAQRAELEAEIEAASTFRSLTEIAKQQALGFLELLEEYGSPCDHAGAVTVGATIDNIAAAMVAEKNDAEMYEKFAESARLDEHEDLAEWMSDMGDASRRTADRLEVVSGLMDSEFEQYEDQEDGEAASDNSTHMNGKRSS